MNSPPDFPPPSNDATATATQEFTLLLGRSSDGDRAAFDEIIRRVYADLRRIAHARLRGERPDHTLNTTALVHEAYVHLVDQAAADWQGKAHFLSVAARVIRNVLVDYARQRGSQKRGGSAVLIPLREDLAGSSEDVVELLAVDQALARLAEQDPRLERVVECRFFAGMTTKQTAEALGVGTRTVERDWIRAKAYLHRELNDASGSDENAPGS